MQQKTMKNKRSQYDQQRQLDAGFRKELQHPLVDSQIKGVFHDLSIYVSFILYYAR